MPQVPLPRERVVVRRLVLLTGLAAGLALSPRAAADVIIPTQMHRTATFELHSVHDDVLLYSGDPQHLLNLQVRPTLSLNPKVDFSNSNQVIVLRVRDLSTFEPAELDSARLADNAELGIEEDPEAEAAVSQQWKIELAPAAATMFVLQCDGGKGLFDFTDMPVREVHLLADSTDVRIEWRRPNTGAPVERVKVTARYGKLDIRGMQNARARSATLQVDDSQCEVDLGGKPWDGEGELFFEGAPQRLRLTLSKRTGLHVEGPATTVAKFDRDGMTVSGNALEDADFASRPCRLRLYFSQSTPKMDVRWSD
jgi:hypothetical protein